MTNLAYITDPGAAKMLHPPKAILETSLYVADVERAVVFYQDILGLRKIDDGYFAGGRGAALQVGSGPSSRAPAECCRRTVPGVPGTSHSGSSRKSFLFGGSACRNTAFPPRRNSHSTKTRRQSTSAIQTKTCSNSLLHLSGRSTNRSHLIMGISCVLTASRGCAGSPRVCPRWTRPFLTVVG